jgi:GR25 family glycosyltransferase involved in LPS biosynthesis
MKSFIIILKEHLQSEIYGNIALASAAKNNWDIERFDAIDGRQQKLEEYNLHPFYNSTKCVRAFIRPGVVGCFLSHYILWNRCLEKNETIGIFEQDIIFQKPPIFQEEFVDILRLDKPELVGRDYGTGDWWEGSHAYILKPSGAKKLINWAKTTGVFPSDVMIGTNVLDINFNLEGLIKINDDPEKISLTRFDKF